MENNKYSCTKCRKDNYTLISKNNGLKDCYPSQGKLINCEEINEDQYGNISCIKCIYNYDFIWSDEYKQNICDNKCAFDSFFNSNLNKMGCYRCDDENGGGEIGCNSTEGCSYNDGKFYCNSCKNGYYNYEGSCFLCSNGDSNCIQCHFSNLENSFKCDKCQNNLFVNKTGLCDVISYDEHPEITPGCIVPNNNYDFYKENNKCYDCIYSFFKTNNESCFYCKARKNGGPKCEKCQYNKKLLYEK